jgi:hypothetical protein
MEVEEYIRALDLPGSAFVRQRIPKTVLARNGAPTPGDRRRINEGIEELVWIATLKATTIGVKEFHDDEREYLEINIIYAKLRPNAKRERLVELIHRAIPYPVFLFLELSENVSMSLAHKRWHQAITAETVLDSDIVQTCINLSLQNDLDRTLLRKISIILQPRRDLFQLYQGWMDTILAYEAGKITGIIKAYNTEEQKTAMQAALKEHTLIINEIDKIRTMAMKEKQIAKQVEMNLEVKRLEERLEQVLAKL